MLLIRSLTDRAKRRINSLSGSFPDLVFPLSLSLTVCNSLQPRTLYRACMKAKKRAPASRHDVPPAEICNCLLQILSVWGLCHCRQAQRALREKHLSWVFRVRVHGFDRRRSSVVMSVVTIRGALGHAVRGCMDCGCTDMVFSMFVKFEVVCM